MKDYRYALETGLLQHLFFAKVNEAGNVLHLTAEKIIFPITEQRRV